MAEVDPGLSGETYQSAQSQLAAQPPETAEPPVPFPDHDVAAVAAVVGALAGLATRDPALYGPSVETLAITEDEGPDWAAVVADTVTWVLSVHGVTAEDLWQGYYALNERVTQAAGAAAGEGKA